jgi:hypothetical protein
MSDEGVMLGTHAGVDDRYNEPFNKAIRDVCLEFGYAPSNDAIDGLKRDFSFVNGEHAPSDTRYWHRQCVLDKRVGRWAPPYLQRVSYAVMMAIRSLLHPDSDEAFAVDGVVDDVRKLKERAT